MAHWGVDVKVVQPNGIYHNALTTVVPHTPQLRYALATGKLADPETRAALEIWARRAAPTDLVPRGECHAGATGSEASVHGTLRRASTPPGLAPPASADKKVIYP